MKKNKLYGIILVLLGAFATCIDGNLASFIFLAIIGIGLFFTHENAIM